MIIIITIITTTTIIIINSNNKQTTTAAKMMFNKHWSDVPIPSQIKPTRWIYALHNLQGHLPVSQILILELNVYKDVSSL